MYPSFFIKYRLQCLAKVFFIKYFFLNQNHNLKILQYYFYETRTDTETYNYPSTPYLYTQ